MSNISIKADMNLLAEIVKRTVGHIDL